MILATIFPIAFQLSFEQAEQERHSLFDEKQQSVQFFLRRSQKNNRQEMFEVLPPHAGLKNGSVQYPGGYSNDRL